jgi:nitrite reductase/ring-hydroxylating ferredoxin subunit
LVCPWHGFEFDLSTGKEVFWKRPASLRMYPIEDIDGEIFVMM